MIERREISVERLTVDPVQSRDEAWVGDETDRELAASIATRGLLQDLIVRPLEASALEADGDRLAETDAEYAIIAGSRRYQAAVDAGYETLPCKLIRADDLDAAWASLHENTTRRDLSEQEIATQLKLIYDLVRPQEAPESCPDCGTAVDGGTALRSHCTRSDCDLPGSPERGPPPSEPTAETASTVASGLPGRFLTERQALEYVAYQFLGRTDEDAIGLVEGHLRTAELPPLLQSLFKSPDDRSAEERTALSNYGIDTRTRLGSGDGKSGTSREVVQLHDTMATELDGDAVDPTDAVLETVGSLRFDTMSEQELRRTLREFRHDVTTKLDDVESPAAQRETFRDTLHERATDLATIYEELEATRPFKKVDVLGPDTQQHSRWHVRAMQARDVSGHGELVRELYQERLEALAEEAGWH